MFPSYTTTTQLFLIEKNITAGANSGISHNTKGSLIYFLNTRQNLPVPSIKKKIFAPLITKHQKNDTNNWFRLISQSLCTIFAPLITKNQKNDTNKWFRLISQSLCTSKAPHTARCFPSKKRSIVVDGQIWKTSQMGCKIVFDPKNNVKPL